MTQVILVTGASSGFGAMCVRALADAGHVVCASMRETAGRNAPQVDAVPAYSAEHGVRLVTLELDVQSQASCDAAVARVPRLRERRRGLVLWVGSSSHHGGTPPYLAPYFATKAAMDAVAVSYAGELAPWGIETTIVVPGAFTRDTNHLAHAGAPADKATRAACDNGPTEGLAPRILANLAAIEPRALLFPTALA